MSHIDGTARGRRGSLLTALMLGSTLTACAPVFSDLQSAKLLDKGRVELTPSGSYVGNSWDTCSDDDPCGHVQDNFGVQVGVGVHEAVELRARYEHASVIDDGPSFNVVGVGPKVRLVQDHVALYVPVGRGFGGPEEADMGNTWQVHPTLLFGAPLHRNVEVNASAKYLIPLGGEDSEDSVAFNLGLGVGKLEQWALRPEAGVLLVPGEDVRYYHFSLGLSFRPR